MNAEVSDGRQPLKESASKETQMHKIYHAHLHMVCFQELFLITQSNSAPNYAGQQTQQSDSYILAFDCMPSVIVLLMFAASCTYDPLYIGTI